MEIELKHRTFEINRIQSTMREDQRLCQLIILTCVELTALCVVLDKAKSTLHYLPRLSILKKLAYYFVWKCVVLVDASLI